MSSSEAPTLPIGSKSAGNSAASRASKKGGNATGRNRAGASGGGRKAWADFTPTPWLDYGAPPWAAGMSPYGSVLHSKEKGKKESHHDVAGVGTPPATTPTSWGATPTPSGLQQNFNFMPPMMPGMPFMPPALASDPHFAAGMAAAAAAGAAAGAAVVAAAHAAGQLAHAGGSDEDTPLQLEGGENSYSDAVYDSPPWMEQLYGAGGAGGSPPPTIDEMSGDLPSKGSAPHGTGLCRPCAWFWKQSGCQSGADCGYCHLCPEGELKNRKKLKVAAMRMGVLQPASRQERSGAGNARALKLTSLV